MRGFETGLFLRTKGGSVEEYGCSVPKEADEGSRYVFTMVTDNIKMAMSSLKLDKIVEDALNTVLSFIEGLYQMIAILSPERGHTID